jgi:competence protein ComEC
MLFKALAFLSGVMLLQNFNHLPAFPIVMTIIMAMLMVVCFAWRYWQYIELPIWIGIGFVWCLVYVYMQIAWTLPDNLEGKTIQITGIIASIPEVDKQRTAFEFALNSINGEANIKGQPLLHLSWQDPKQQIKVGQRWLFSVRLKKIHGLMNLGGFDAEAWSLQEGIRANGYVYHDAATLLGNPGYHFLINQIREFIYYKIIQVLPTSDTSPWLIALALGIRQGINAENWQVLRNTGTNHIMAIAGLHIGIVSSFIYMLVNKIWRNHRYLVAYLPAQHAAGVAALLTAFVYSALAGFSLPTQRACLMLVIFFVISLCRRYVEVSHVWSLALIGVLILNPLSVLTESFWLSFGSVALIFYGMSNRLHPVGLWWRYGRVQWILTLGLIPLSIWLFQECSLISFVANAVAIPWVGFVIVPLTLIGSIVVLCSAKLGGVIFLLADKLLAILWSILLYLSHLPLAAWYHVVPSLYFFVLAYIGIVLLFLPAGFPGRWLGAICLLPFLLYKPLVPALGEVWFSLLDVGQGLSAVIQTKNHFVVVDAGAHLGGNFDMGESVVAPFLHTLGAQKIDMLVISHRDNDHSGGANAIMQQFPVLTIKTSSPELFSTLNVSYCLQNQKWTWDNVDFEFLSPSTELLGLDNDSSCVLKVATREHQILLPGDIEKLAEKNLLSTERDKMHADILIAPHHGSKTSGLDEFINAVRPSIVLFPVGYRNRYHLPNQGVVQKYDAVDAKHYDSVSAGQIYIKLNDNKKLNPVMYRQIASHYWNKL